MVMICSICPRHCNIDRDIQYGFCRSKSKFKLARAALHYWEEPCISGKQGSGAVFFSGCNLRCAFCQNYEISREGKGIEVTDDRLIEIFENLIAQGANNINLVNPGHYADRLADLLTKWKSPVPIVYNTGGYEEAETIKRLDGLVDIYLPDLKYIRANKAKRYSDAEDYFEKASAAIKEMRRQVQDRFDGGIMKSGLIIRHLILPQNTNSAISILDWIKDNVPDTYVSLMAQYTPCQTLQDLPELNRRITEREYNKVVDYALASGFEKLFLQDISSANKEYIPDFDLSGVL
ncbi:MAG: radical SAM protein [Clostridium sp.]|nr:radical SAM protein [Clostridium sp.]